MYEVKGLLLKTIQPNPKMLISEGGLQNACMGTDWVTISRPSVPMKACWKPGRKDWYLLISKRHCICNRRS